jgi:hypothetical protein
MKRVLPLLAAVLLSELIAVGVACGGEEATPTPVRATAAVRVPTPTPRTTSLPTPRVPRVSPTTTR